MTSQKKTALIFLTAINIINLIAGIMTQITMAFERDVTSIIPIKAELTVTQILVINFMAVVVLITLINIVTTYLSTDISYSFKEIISNCPTISLLIPVLLLFSAIYNTIVAQTITDRAFIIISSVIYIFACAINFGCMATIKEDAD